MANTNSILIAFSLTAIAFFSCSNNAAKKASANNEKSMTETETSVVASSYDNDLTPEGFKNEHYDEWVVVNNGINILQNGSKTIDFNAIDKCVKGYIELRKIVLPNGSLQKITEIEKICKSKFEIYDYAYSNEEMNLADQLDKLYDKYVIWLLSSEAKR